MVAFYGHYSLCLRPGATSGINSCNSFVIVFSSASVAFFHSGCLFYCVMSGQVSFLWSFDLPFHWVALLARHCLVILLNRGCLIAVCLRTQLLRCIA